MKLKTKLFGRTFFELETDDILEIENKDELSQSVIDNIEKSKTQLDYVIGDTQYENLKKTKDAFYKLGTVPFPENATENDKEIWRKAYTSGVTCLVNLISSYEHFKEKRDALKTSN